MTDDPTTILLVDDHELIRAGLAAAFTRDPGMRVLGQAENVAGAVAAYDGLKPDVVVTDLHLPDGTGLDIVRRLRAQSETVGLVILTMHSGDDQIFAAMEAGASGFVGKDAPAAEVVRTAAHAARSPRTFICAGLAQAMMRRMSGESTRLSEREHEILLHLADGLGTQQIAQRLHISESTTKSHIARIYQKLGATNRAQAVVTAMRVGLLSSVQRRAD